MIGWHADSSARGSAVLLAATLALSSGAAARLPAGERAPRVGSGPRPSDPAPLHLFRPYVSVPTHALARAAAIGDVDGDGRNDVVVTTWDGSADPLDNYALLVFLQDPQGRLSAPVRYPIGQIADSVAVGDVNGDGRSDVVVGAGSAVGVFLQGPSGTLGPMVLYASPYSAAVKTGDFNGDGRSDVVGMDSGYNPYQSGVAVFLQNATGTLDPPAVSLASHGGLPDMAVGDVTGDGRDDVVVMTGTTLSPDMGNLAVLAQLAGGGFAPPVPYIAGSPFTTHAVAIGDVNGDGRNDLVASYGGSPPNSSVDVWPQNAGGGLDPFSALPAWDNPGAVEVADLNGDSRPDVLVRHDGSSLVGALLQNVDGTLAPEAFVYIPYTSWDKPDALAIGDVNGDGFPDAVLAHDAQGLVVLYRLPRYDLGATLTAPASPVAPGTTVTYTATVANGGIDALTDVQLVDAVPGGMLFASSSAGCTAAGAVVTCGLGTLAPGAEVTVSVSLIPVSAGTFVNHVSVSASEPDSEPANDSASASVVARALACAERVQDGGFEAGIPNPYWLEYSSTFGTPLCTRALCGNGGGTAKPRSGLVWAWFGGASGHSELGALAQDIQLPWGTASLRFYLWNGLSSGNPADYFSVFMDGALVFSTPAGRPAYSGGYVPVTVDVGAFADRGAHRVQFQSYMAGPGTTNFSLDDVSITGCEQIPTFVSVSDAVVTEGGLGPVTASFTVSLSAPSTRTVTTSWATADGTAHAGADYIPASGNLVLPPGATAATVSVTVLGDRIHEGDETFYVNLTPPVGALPAKTQGIDVIEDDDPAGFSIDDVTVTAPRSGPAQAVFHVTLAPAVGGATVDFATEDDTAVAGVDYAASSGTLVFPAGIVDQVVPITILPRAQPEGARTFRVLLSGAEGAPIGYAQGTGTILPPGFHTLTPCRAFDTRNPLDGPALQAGVARTIPLQGLCGIPPTARAVSLNVTVAQPTAPGYLTLYPGGASAPNTSTLNYSAGQTRANNALVPLGATGQLSIYCGQGSGTVHAIVDVNGYFTSE